MIQIVSTGVGGDVVGQLPDGTLLQAVMVEPSAGAHHFTPFVSIRTDNTLVTMHQRIEISWQPDGD